MGMVRVAATASTDCSRTERAQDGGIEPHQFLCETAERLRLPARRSKLQDNILSLDVTQFAQSRSQGSDRLRVHAGRQRGSDHDTHHRHLSRLLCVHDRRPRENVEYNPTDERPPSITEAPYRRMEKSKILRPPVALNPVARATAFPTIAAEWGRSGGTRYGGYWLLSKGRK